MNHNELIKLAKRHLEGSKEAGYFALDTFHKYGERPDLMCLVSDPPMVAELWQVECKVSRSDFIANRKKTIGIGHRRIFLVTAGVCAPSDLPRGWGLWLVVEDDSDRPYISEVADSEWFEMNDASWIQTIKLYSHEVRKAKSEPQVNSEDEKLIEFLTACPNARLTQIKVEFDLTDAEGRALVKAVRAGEKRPIKCTHDGVYYVDESRRKAS